MKKLGIVVAMNKEFDSLGALLGTPVKTESIIGVNFLMYASRHYDIIVAHCGIGEIYAASATALLISSYGAEEIINYGFVGALSDKYKVFDILAVRDVVHYDMDLTAFGNALGQYDDRPHEAWDADRALTARLTGGYSLPFERIASADKFVRFKTAKQNLAELFGAEMCDMESAGVAVVASRANVPFASIKLIVDGIEGDSHASFEVNAKKGAEVLARIIQRYIEGE